MLESPPDQELNVEIAGAACEMQTSIAEEVPRDRRTVVRMAIQECGEDLYRFILYRVCGDRHVADDLVQQTCYEAARHARPPAVPDEIEAWLRGIARNLIRHHWRIRRRQAVFVSLEEAAVATRLADDMEDRPLPLDVLIRDEVRCCLATAIAELPIEDQELIYEYYFEGRAQAEIAVRCGTTEKSIESRLYRARGRLRKALRQLGRSGES